MDIVVSQLMTGLSIASILMLVALGLAIIYGVTGVINLAHGEFVMLGAYVAWALQAEFGMGLLASLVPIFLIMAAVGWLVEVLVISRLYGRLLDTILATWGIGVMAQQAVRLVVGGELRYVQMPESLSKSVTILGATDSAYRLFILFVALALFGVTWVIYRYTNFGLKLRAITQNRAVASSFGINTSRIYRLTFAYGAGMAGLAGALVSPLKSVSPEMGTTYVVDAFMVVVLGGTQSLMGTLASSGILGELSGYLAFYSNDTIAKALVLVAIVALIRFRPQGLFTAHART
ncbi:urea ABC transporter permease subunit UrtB [Mesorhizobium sp. BH1-1-5]|uniref:urea ABC transporter permease subunit UrtB n=1 Tax=unclassified Mesorhizobium TaxID=325217 RepID=UPI001126AF81|nr:MULTISPECIES: urea ABC transporter permease subunit UrtB [unclassified Mesorhizobium]MBZ9988138.1 urea ABC transporter permease subunit UrtB [Mesorhizobium sp. BH1-1-5]TPJ74629.1 urea ABC transporter permease subunit UrtB [Mesorhizobium sp. B2-7-1]